MSESHPPWAINAIRCDSAGGQWRVRTYLRRGIGLIGAVLHFCCPSLFDQSIVLAIPIDGDQTAGLWMRGVVVGAIAYYIKRLAELITSTFWAD